jgi:hypothetical protein
MLVWLGTGQSAQFWVSEMSVIHRQLGVVTRENGDLTATITPLGAFGQFWVVM